ncbi:hypothetical protein BDV96DRAFT_256785 [Lophiotrema nucula]|uniref:Uncharacterized protein n=1 Tax=Lophiotrema nucula TaxID=690887 RepID=A0A6A5YRA7_9PLEO|nr:hypothetical protein BDV96DRAFT_256785 [Lophiotrema nucula]
MEQREVTSSSSSIGSSITFISAPHVPHPPTSSTKISTSATPTNAPSTFSVSAPTALSTHRETIIVDTHSAPPRIPPLTHHVPSTLATSTQSASSQPSSSIQLTSYGPKPLGPTPPEIIGISFGAIFACLLLYGVAHKYWNWRRMKRARSRTLERLGDGSQGQERVGMERYPQKPIFE